MNTIPLDPQDISNLETVKQRQRNIQREVEKIGVDRFNLELRFENAKKAFNENSKMQQELGTYLQTKYGQGVIDLENKVFIPNNASQ